MLIRLTRLSNDRHRLEIRRADGSTEARELETRSLLAHDLVHYSVEAEGQLVSGFYGALARGAHLTDPFEPTGEAMMIETIVGPMQSALAANRLSEPPEAFIAGIAAYLAQTGRVPPAWLTPDYVSAVRERLRQVLGQWRATPFGETMELTFP